MGYVVSRNKFTTAETQNTKNKMFGDKIDYISRKTKNTSQDGYLMRTETQKNKKLVYYNSSGPVYRNEKTKRQKTKNIFNQNQTNLNGCIYENVLSLDKKFKDKYLSDLSDDEIFDIVKPRLENFITDNNMELKNVEYVVAFHHNTNNLHLHFDFVEIVPSKTKNLNTLKSIKSLKRNVINDIAPDLHKIEIDNFEKITNLQNLIINKFDVSKIKNINFSDIKSAKSFKTLSENIKDSITKQVQNILDINTDYKRYKEHLRYHEQLLKKKYGDSNDRYTDTKLQQLNSSIGNKVLKVLKIDKKKVEITKEINE